MVSALNMIALSYTLKGFEVAIVPFLFFVLVGLIIVLPLAIFRRAYFYSRRLKKNVITAEYEPPLGFNPAEVGYIFDGKLRQREIAATVIHLIQRGFLHVKNVDGAKKIFTGPRVGNDLKTYEKKLIEEAEKKPHGADIDDLLSRFMSYKSKNVQTPLVSRELLFTQLVHSDLYRRQYVRRSTFWPFISGSFKIAVMLAGVVIFLPITLLWTLSTISSGATDAGTFFGLMLVCIVFSVVLFLPLLIAGSVLNYVRGRIVGREWIITPKLKRLWPQIVGYRQYVKLVENERLEFHSKNLEQISKNDSLPYAIALGFVKNWRDILS